VGEITVSVVGSKNPNWFDTHQIPKNAAYAIPDEAATRLMTASLDVTDPTAATRVVSDAVDHFGRIDVLVNNAGSGLITAFEEMSPEQGDPNALGRLLAASSTVERAGGGPRRT
jgi:NAD(P)-dependent dehydrogenase (short-subunit alcohol dehydrogenase family)